MDRPIINLMHDCVVKLSLPHSEGTGFFVAPGLILTCAHVVENETLEKYYDGKINVRWKENIDFAEAQVIPKKWLPDADIALLSCKLEPSQQPPCVLLGKVCETEHRLASFGYPIKLEDADPATFICSGYTGGNQQKIIYKLDNIKEGMSGSPVLNLETNRVCGMINFSNDTKRLHGGGGVPVEVILKLFDELAGLQEEYHNKNPKWYGAIGLKTPSDLSDAVRNNIAEKLLEPGSKVVAASIKHLFDQEKGIVVQSTMEIAVNLIKMNMTETLPMIYKARKKAISYLKRKRESGKTFQLVKNCVFDVLGWLVLLSVNTSWLEKHQGRFYPEDFPGSIELSVKTETGIEIMLAAIDQRCARFNLDKGILYGANRMPSADHEFMEGGMSAVHVVNEIKKSIYIYLNQDWGKESIPDHFTEDDDEELDSQLEWFNGQNDGRYLVVRRSSINCLINRDVFIRLKSQLPNLQIIFHNIGQKTPLFNVSEVKLSTQLRNFLLPE